MAKFKLIQEWRPSSYIQRVWRSHGLQPHRIRTVMLSNDPQFAAKVRDIVGLIRRTKTGGGSGEELSG